MKRLVVLTAVLLCSLFSKQVFAGGDSLWFPSGTLGLNVSQVSFSDWAQGGDDAISWTFLTNMALEYKGSSWNLKNKMKLAYGRTKIGSDDYRTNNNELYLENVVSYLAGWTVNPFFSNTIRSTVTVGYEYKNQKANRIADFFDPGYISQSLGFTYREGKLFGTRMGLALQETFTNEYRNYSDNIKTKDKKEAFKLESGLECVTDSEIALDGNLLFQSNLRLFTRFDYLDIWDVRWDNQITAKVTKYLNVNLGCLVVYEKSQSPKTQVKQSLQMGLVYSLFNS